MRVPLCDMERGLKGKAGTLRANAAFVEAIQHEISDEHQRQIKEAAGFVKEEANEHGTSPESQKKAAEGRKLRNEGRVEDGKAPKTTAPGFTTRKSNSIKCDMPPALRAAFCRRGVNQWH